MRREKGIVFKVSIPQAVSTVATGEFYRARILSATVSIPQAVSTVATYTDKKDNIYANIELSFQYRKR